MIKRSTWMMLVFFVLVIAGYFIFRGRISSASTVPTSTAVSESYLINSADGTLVSLRIYDNDYRTTQLQRDSTGTWTISQPNESAADQSLAGAAESQVGALKILTILTSQLSLKDLGLDFPAYTIQLTFSGGKQHKLEVGTVTPTGTGYYVRFDSGTIYVISKDGIDALTNLITSPPYPATETPPPTPQVTDTPGAAITLTMPATSAP